MIQIKEKTNCCGCQACAQICPKACITMQPDEEGFLYPVIEEARCVDCGLCEKACPVLNSVEQKKDAPIAYAAYNLDEEIRLNSSSGGIFTLLAEAVLAKNGVVYGAAMDNAYVKHIRVERQEELDVLRGSKYVQSDIGNTYIQAKQDLCNGKEVLFTGTPCQIEGLKFFLQKDYENLICMDIICHGVPSPMVWEKYVAYREKAAGVPAERIFFRHKKYGWKIYAVLFEFSNKTAYVQLAPEDLFMQAFLRDVCLRPSCYQCKFKKENRISDITAADFWGIQKNCPEMDDDKGTSLVIVHSKKGQKIFSEIINHMNYEQVDFYSAIIPANTAMIRSAKRPESREQFIQEILEGDSFKRAVLKYAKRPFNLKAWIKKIVKSILHHMGLLSFAKQMKKKLF